VKSEYLLEVHIKCQIQWSEITEILFLMEATRERDLHKSLKLLLKEWEKGLRLFIDFRLQSSNSKESSGITLSGSNVAWLTPWLPKKWAGRPTMD